MPWRGSIVLDHAPRESEQLFWATCWHIISCLLSYAWVATSATLPSTWAGIQIGDGAAVRKAITRARGRIDPLVGLTYLQTCSFASGPAEAAPFEQPAVVRFKKRFNKVPVDEEAEKIRRRIDADIAAKALFSQGRKPEVAGDEGQRTNRFDRDLCGVEVPEKPQEDLNLDGAELTDNAALAAALQATVRQEKWVCNIMELRHVWFFAWLGKWAEALCWKLVWILMLLCLSRVVIAYCFCTTAVFGTMRVHGADVSS